VHHRISKLSAVDMSVFLYFSLRNGILHGLFDVFVSNNLSLHAMFLLGRTNATKTSFPGAFAIILKDVQLMATFFTSVCSISRNSLWNLFLVLHHVLHDACVSVCMFVRLYVCMFVCLFVCP
jgi:hypothetical protein